MDSKDSLRKKIIGERQNIDGKKALLASQAVAGALLKLIPHDAKIAGYWPMRGEIDIKEPLNQLYKIGNIVSLPIIPDTEKILKFLKYSPNTNLVAGKFGTLCPPADSPEITPDIVIIPMVGFDEKGHRLGYGGGYYDATLAHLRSRNKNLLAIGVAYSLQKTHKLPTHNGDQKMDIIVTEKKVINFC